VVIWVTQGNSPSDNDASKKNATDSVLFDIKDHIATITLNRPEKRNALRIEEFDRLIKYIHEADSNPSAHVIRICSSGDRAFSAGLDLNMLQQLTPETAPTLLEVGNNTIRTIIQAKKPVVIQVQGPAVAWGSLPEIDIGLFPATGALTMGLFNMGYRRAKRVLMIPERISLDDAEEIGLVTQRCPIESLEQETMKFCQSLAAKPQGILIPIKALINNFHLRDLEFYFEKEFEAIELSMGGGPQNFDEFLERLWKK
jgi:2-(1,2-epoxy-1,2-dihydrophenyl)acetyl-CoA isomerase